MTTPNEKHAHTPEDEGPESSRGGNWHSPPTGRGRHDRQPRPETGRAGASTPVSEVNRLRRPNRYSPDPVRRAVWWLYLLGAAALAALVYLAIYGDSIEVSVRLWRGIDVAAGQATNESALKQFVRTLLGAGVAAMGVGAIMGRAPWTSRPALPWPVVALGTGLFLILVGGGALIIGVPLDGHDMLWHPDRSDTPVLAGLLSSAAAGIGEEVIVLAVPVFLLRQAFGARRIGSAIAVCVAVTFLAVLRVAYHLYYGPGALWVVPWAIGAAYLFWRWPSPRLLIGFIIAHTLYDALAYLGADARMWGLLAGGVLFLLALTTSRSVSWPPLPNPMPDRRFARKKTSNRARTPIASEPWE